MVQRLILILAIFKSTISLCAQSNDPFRRGFELKDGKENLNPYQLSPEDLTQSISRGEKYLSRYPIPSTRLLLPSQLMEEFFTGDLKTRPFLNFVSTILNLKPFKSKREFYDWLGLSQSMHSAQIPTDDDYYGVTEITRNQSKGMTFGCAACHVGTLFGKPIIGLSTRFPRANQLFVLSSRLFKTIPPELAATLLSASPEERALVLEDGAAAKSIGAKTPSSLGLDTSLAQVGLSLNKRSKDEIASFDHRLAARPPNHYLMNHRADSKPAVWWNLKYKTKWLSDGSLEGGNPVYTNFLWNELGRGADLVELEAWLKENESLAKDMIHALLHIKPPRYMEFLGADSIDIPKAKRGEVVYNQNCSSCHGTYRKAWSEETLEDKTATISLTYHTSTPVLDVGTDPYRYLGMSSFAEDLNRLSISKFMGTVVVPKKGYVPPPLDGIWARFPYMHNNSIPTLCDVLSPTKKRPIIYYAVDPKDPNDDFDATCLGYPASPIKPKKFAVKFDTRILGQGNGGHDEGIFIKNGRELLSAEDKWSLLEFLKTL
jgi:hypothetical protein